MTSDRREELLSAALDGDLNDEERAELDALLADNEGRQVANDYTELHSLLGKLAAATPPESLHDLIAGQVQLPAAAAPKKQGWQWLFPGIRYAVAVAAGAMAAVAVLTVDPTIGNAPTGALTGSMAPAAATSGTAPAASYEFAGNGVDGRASLSWRESSELLLDLEFSAARPVEIAVSFGSHRLRVETFSGLDEGVESISLEDGTLAVRAQGRRRLQALVHFKDGKDDISDSIRLEVSSDGELLDQGTLQLAR